MAVCMASRKGCGEYDFVEQPPEEYSCPVSLAVLLEPYQTQCCGNHLSKESYERLQGQPCPVCREENLTAMKDKFHKRKVMSLKVRCPHKAEGCEWEGELGSLEQHLSADGECGYVDVDCPYACGKRIQRRALELHVKDCNILQPQVVLKLEAVIQEQAEQIKQQGSQIMQLIAQIKQDGEQQKDQIKQQGDQIKQDKDLIKQQGDQIKQQGDQIALLAAQHKQQGNLIKIFSKALIPPVSIVMDEFRKHKREDDVWYSPPFYTHLGGYKMCLGVYANGHKEAKGTHVSVYICLMRGEFDDDLKWPFCGTVVIHLKQPPYYKDAYYCKETICFKSDNSNATKPASERSRGIGIPDYIPHYASALCFKEHLQNDELVFCISDIVIRSK